MIKPAPEREVYPSLRRYLRRKGEPSDDGS